MSAGPSRSLMEASDIELAPAVTITPTDSPGCDHQRPTAVRNRGASALSRPACYPPPARREHPLSRF
ncbi:unnamed protein product [Leuciscus chuanchicus]